MTNTHSTLKASHDTNPSIAKRKKLMLDTIVSYLMDTKLKSKNHYLAKKIYKDVMLNYKDLIPGLNLPMLKARVHRRYVKHPMYKKVNVIPPPPVNLDDINDDQEDNAPKKTGGRPKGATNQKKRESNIAHARARNEITCLYYSKMSNLRSQTEKARCVKNGLFNKIKNDVMVNRDLPDSFKFTYNTCIKRISRGKLETAETHGPKSPLHVIEKDLVQLLLLLGATGSPLTAPQVILLTNSLIRDTPTQQKLVAWKRKNKMKGSAFELGRVGYKYYKNFMNRHKHQLVSKRGRRFELNREKWTTYTNFKNMYEDHEEEMISAGVAERLDTPIWMNKKGEEVTTENDAYGCKVRTRLTRPDMCITLDEVGCNTSQLKDGHVGGQHFVVGKKQEARKLATKKDKHFTCLGLTTLSGETVMCVVIIQGKTRNILFETGVDLDADAIGEKKDEEDYEFFLNNIGKDKLYPGGPTCNFKGKDVPCMVEFSDSGGITSSILTKIFQTIDTLKIYENDRNEGLRPYIILDGHQSRFDLDFLTYMNDESHPWSVVIGVPYGTALWQVGDSQQQNGMFKVRLCRAKEFIMEKRERLFLDLEILPTDIIPMVNYAWSGSFANLASNLEAIVERGWSPLNRNLLLHPLLRATMTKEEKAEEVVSACIPSKYLNEQHANNTNNNTLLCSYCTCSTTSNPHTSPTQERQQQTTPPTTYNFDNGFSSTILDKMVSQNDMNNSRKRNYDMKKIGSTLEHKLKLMSRKSSAQLVLVAQVHVLGKPLTQRIKEDIMLLQQQQQEATLKKDLHYLTICEDADKVKLKNADKPSYDSWSVNDLKAFLKPLKRKSDGKMPSRKADLVHLAQVCEGRVRTRHEDDISQAVAATPQTQQEDSALNNTVASAV